MFETREVRVQDHRFEEPVQVAEHYLHLERVAQAADIL